MARCYHGARIINDTKRYDRCNEPCVPGKRFCEAHLAEALARVATVRDDRPKPWPSTPPCVKAS